MHLDNFVLLLPFIGITIAILMLIQQRKNQFIPRITIAGLDNCGKSNLFSALVTCRASQMHESETCLIYEGYQRFLMVKMEIILLATDFNRWNKDVKNLKHKLYNSIVIVVPTTYENYIESVNYVAKNLPAFVGGITYIVQYSNEQTDYTEELKLLLEAKFQIVLNKNQFVKANLSVNAWDVKALFQRLNELI